MIVKAFGYVFNVFKLRKDQPKLNNRKLCQIRRVGPYLLLCDHEGNHLPVQINATVINDLNKPSRAIIELFVSLDNIDLEPNREESSADTLKEVTGNLK
jgi:hypothetical protein